MKEIRKPKKTLTIDATKVTDLEWDNVDVADYPDFSDAYASAGEIEIDYFHPDGWMSIVRKMTDAELDAFNEQFSIHDFEDVAADSMADAMDDARDAAKEAMYDDD